MGESVHHGSGSRNELTTIFIGNGVPNYQMRLCDCVKRHNPTWGQFLRILSSSAFRCFEACGSMQRLLLGGMQLDFTGTDEQASGIIALSCWCAQLLIEPKVNDCRPLQGYIDSSEGTLANFASANQGSISSKIRPASGWKMRPMRRSTRFSLCSGCALMNFAMLNSRV